MAGYPYGGFWGRFYFRHRLSLCLRRRDCLRLAFGRRQVIGGLELRLVLSRLLLGFEQVAFVRVGLPIGNALWRNLSF